MGSEITIPDIIRSILLREGLNKIINGLSIYQSLFNNFTGLNTVFAMIMAYLLYDEISLQLTWDRNISPRSCKMSGPSLPPVHLSMHTGL